MSREKLLTARKLLIKDLRGRLQEIADHCQVSKSTVSNVLNDKYKNDCVMEEALRLRKEVIEQRNESINNKLKQLSQ